MKTKLPIILIFAAMIGLIGLIAAARISQRPDVSDERVVEPVLVRAIPVETHDVTLHETFHGFVEADLRVAMSFQIAGRLESFGSDDNDMLVEGDQVTKGQVIARLEEDRYEAALKQAQARQREAKALIAAAEAEITRAKASRLDAERELNRLSNLATQDVATNREVERAEIVVDQAVAAELGAQAQLQSAEASYSQAEAAVLAAKVNLDDATLRSPIDGHVASVSAERGQVMQPGEPVMSLVRMNPVRLAIGVGENRIATLEAGQRVEVSILALRSSRAREGMQAANEGLFEGVVVVVPPAADPQSGVFRIEIALPNESGVLRPGMVAKAKVNIGRQNVTLVPVEATYTEGDDVFVYAADDADPPIARRKSLTVVGTQDDTYLVLQRPEDLGSIIVQGQSQLRDGQPVRFEAAPDSRRAATSP